jgi:hypothetical protein
MAVLFVSLGGVLKGLRPTASLQCEGAENLSSIRLINYLIYRYIYYRRKIFQFEGTSITDAKYQGKSLASNIMTYVI